MKLSELKKVISDIEEIEGTDYNPDVTCSFITLIPVSEDEDAEINSVSIENTGIRMASLDTDHDELRLFNSSNSKKELDAYEQIFDDGFK